jgi:CRISPR/Cas system-associated endoribonuclease Cas2
VSQTPTPWIITFDVAADRNRRAVHRTLSAHGPRVLNTVYEITTAPSDAAALLQAAEEQLRTGDHLLAVPRCPRCRSAHRGGTAEPPAPFGWAVG